MSKIKSTIWKIEPHTEAKLGILRKYLDAWLPIMAKWNGRIVYVDGFAGPGEYIGGKDGSPIIAVKAVLEHKANIVSQITMLFVEKDKDRADFLESKLSAIKTPSNLNYKVAHAKFDEHLKEVLGPIDAQKARLAPAFVFIDPFGFTGIPFNLIKRIMQNDKCEVLITFMYEEINRFISSQKLWPNLVETFGTDKWKEIITETNPSIRENKLRRIYKQQLEQEAGIRFVRSFKMTNKVNRTDYFLFFGTNSVTGLKKMKEAMWRTDQTGAFQFSDATYNPDQAVLFELGPDYDELKKTLVRNFKAKIVSVQEIENFVITQTPFRETHYKRQILAKMEKANPSEINVKCIGNRRRGTFPNHCMIEFL